MTTHILSWLRAKPHSVPAYGRPLSGAGECLARKHVECKEFDHCAECTPIEQVRRIAKGLAGHPLMVD